MDAVTEEYNILNANVIVLQYVISHFYNSGQIGEIESFLKNWFRILFYIRNKESH